MGFASEVYLTSKNVLKDEWKEFINTISKYNGLLKRWKLLVIFKNNELHYMVNTNCVLPTSINGLKSFILKRCAVKKSGRNRVALPFNVSLGSNIIDIKNYFSLRGKGEVQYIEFEFMGFTNDKVFNKVRICVKKARSFKYYKLLFGLPEVLLAVNFESNYDLVYKGAPKYLDISKCLYLLKTDKANTIFSVDPFPYLQGEYFLEQKNINFARHSIVFGASGCGKSKFLSLLISNIKKDDLFRSKYKVVVIDPHAALEDDIGGLGKVIDFKEASDSINLFLNNSSDVVISVELLLDIFKGLIPNNYNSKLERVLRHSLYLLLVSEKFNFSNLRNLLIEMEFRNDLVKSNRKILPDSIVEFFLAEFNEIKTKSYTEAISPIIAFIDEMEMIPVFNRNDIESNLCETIKNNFLTIFSLDRTRLGEKVTRTIAGLVAQQLFTLVQNYTFDQHIIFIVDEVAVVENPILNRFLAEARKYNLSLILAGQYFNGISNSLKKAVFANAVNYYIFRLSQDDANILADNFNMKVPLKDTKEQKVKIITDLQDRECLIRINSNGYLLPVMKCRTLDFKSIPRIKEEKSKNIEKKVVEKKKKIGFSMGTNVSLNDILKVNSSSRKGVEDEWEDCFRHS